MLLWAKSVDVVELLNVGLGYQMVLWLYITCKGQSVPNNYMKIKLYVDAMDDETQ